MRNLSYVLLLFLIIGCDSESPSVSYEEQVSTALNQNPEVNPLESTSLFYQDLSYGSAERNTFDLMVPKDGDAIGIVIFFHGGSFLFNDKTDAYQEPFAGIINNLLNENVAVVNANYSFLNSPNSMGLTTSLSDGTLLLNHIRSIASSLNLNANKIVLSGASSGAGISLWNGLQADHNQGVVGIVALATQSSYNLYAWENLFPNLSVDQITQNSQEFQLLFNLFYGGPSPTQAQLDAVDFIEFMDPADPELYLYNTAGNEVVRSDGSIDLDVLYHSIRHSDALRAKAIQEGFTTSGAFQETPEAFVLRKLR